MSHEYVLKPFTPEIRLNIDYPRELNEQQLAAVTCGANGCFYLTEDNPSEARHQPAFKVKAVDTTGCGDVFHGAYAAALARGMSAPERIRFASAAAALKAQKSGGAQRGIPSLAATMRFMGKAERAIDSNKEGISRQS